MLRVSSLIGLTIAMLHPLCSIASVTDDLDTKIRLFKNDGDGMRYIVLRSKKRSVAYSSIYEYPLSAKNEIRYQEDANNEPLGINLFPGRAGLFKSRPLADLEVLKYTTAFLQLNDAETATGIAVNPSGVELGSLSGEYTPKTLADSNCTIKLYSQGIDVCGTIIGRLGVVNYTMLDTRRCDGWGRYCATQIFKFDFGYKSAQGRDSVQFYMLNARVALDLNQRLSSWLGSNFATIR